MVLRARRRRSTSTSTTCRAGADRPRRAASELFDFLEFRTLFERLAEVLGAPIAAPRRRRRRGARGRGDRGSTSAGRRRSTALRRRRARSTWRRRGPAPPGRSPLDRAGRRARRRRRPTVAWVPGAAARRPRRAVARSPTAGRVRGPRRQGAHARPGSAVGVDLRVAGRSTPRSPPTCSTRPRPATCSPTSSAATRGDSLPDRRRRARGPARPRRRRRSTTRSARPGARSPSAGWSPPLDAALDAQGMRTLYDDDRGPARRACWPAWRTSASASTSPSCRRLNDRLDGGVPAAGRARSATAPGEEFNVNSTPQLRQILFDELGLTPAEEDEDRLLHRRRVAREAARPAPDHRAPAARTARSRSCARPTARACWPRSAPDGRIHATFNQTVARTGRLSRTSRTCTTSRCAPRRAASSAGVRARARAPSCSSPTTTRSSCAASPTWPRTRA